MAAVVAIGVFAASQKASAATLTYSGTVNVTATNWSNDINITKFDTNLGTLTSIEIILSGTATTTISLTNNVTGGGTDGPATGNVKTEVKFALKDAGSFIATSTRIDMFLPDSDGVDYSLAAGQSQSFGPFAGTGSNDQTYTSSNALNEFSAAGGGSIALTATGSAATLLSNTGGNTSATQSTTAGAVATVIYTYTIPEPSTYAMIGLGLGVAGFAYLRRRQADKA